MGTWCFIYCFRLVIYKKKISAQYNGTSSRVEFLLNLQRRKDQPPKEKKIYARLINRLGKLSILINFFVCPIEKYLLSCFKSYVKKTTQFKNKIKCKYSVNGTFYRSQINK